VPNRQFIPSIALTSTLIDFNAVPQGVITASLTEALGVFSKDNRFKWPEGKLPGYEPAMISLALLQCRHSRASEFIDRMLELRDPTGAWVEYYTDAIPQGCRCRPWESGLSLLALLKHAAGS
jgi:hypothetical protein